MLNLTKMSTSPGDNHLNIFEKIENNSIYCTLITVEREVINLNAVKKFLIQVRT